MADHSGTNIVTDDLITELNSVSTERCENKDNYLITLIVMNLWMVWTVFNDAY